MKRCLAILLSVLLLMTSVPMVSATTPDPVPDVPTIEITSGEAKPGETVSVTVYTHNNPGVVSMKVKVWFDPAVLKLVGYEAGNFSASGYSWGQIKADNFIINWCDAISVDSTADVLATLTFEVLADATCGVTPLTLDFSCEDDMYNFDWETIEFAGINNEITVNHTWNADVLEPDCFNGGYTTYTCSVCGDSYVGDYTDALGHTEEIIPGKDATCTEDGLTEGKKCSVCGEIIVAQQVIKANSHAEEIIPGKAATCTEDGLTEGKKCSVCGEILAAQQVIKANGHTEEIIPGKAATCTEDGLTEGKKCSVCGEIIVAQQVIKANGHTEEIIPGKAATCTEDGLTEGKKCSVCGEILVAQQVIKANGHTEEIIPGKAATCTEDGLTEGKKCSVCGEIIVAQQVIKANGHTEEIIPGKAATCTEDGLTEGKKCSVCGEIIVAQQVIKANGHAEEIIPGKAATCTEDGLTEGKKCSVCGEILVAQQVIKAIGHSYESVVTAPTCVAEGYTTYTCSACGHSYVADYVAALGHTEEVIPGYDATCTETGLTEGEKCSVCDEVLVAQQVIKANGHTEEIIPGYDATCTETGLTEGKQCSVCGETLIAQEIIPALGHSYDAVVTAPTCVAEGYTTYTCACGDSYVANKVPATGHIYDDEFDAECNACGFIRDAQCKHDYQAVVTAPDCVNGGYTTYTCSACGDSYVADYTDALGHTEEIIPGKAATCTEDGLTEGKKCSVCGEILVAQQVIKANGHTEEIIPGKAATCTEDGLTEGKKCSVCGEIIVAQEIIPALGHNYESVVTAPTCVAEGYTTHTCSVCGDSYTDSVVPATGEHVYDGDSDADCNVCGAIREVETAKPGDADGNGRVNNRDLGFIQQYLNDWPDVKLDLDACDVDDNGRVNNRDLGLIQQYLNDWGTILK